MTQLYSLADLVENGIEIRSLKDITMESKYPRAYDKYFEIEKRLIDEGKAVNLESYLLQEYQFNQRNVKEIAKEFDIHRDQVYRIICKLNIPTRTQKEIRNIIGFSDSAIQKMSDAKKGNKNPMHGKKGKEHPMYGIKRTFTLEHRENMSMAHLHGVERPAREELEDYYIIKEKTIIEVAEDYHVHKTTMSKWLKSYGIPVRKGGEKSKINVPEKQITETCRRDDLTFAEKAQELEISYITLYKRLKEFGIKNTRKKHVGGEQTKQ